MTCNVCVDGTYAATGLEHLNDALSEFESLNLLERCAEAIAVFIAVFRRVHVLRDEEIPNQEKKM